MISMELTSKYVHMLEGVGNGKNVTVRKTVSVPVPERSVRNGYIRNEEELSGALIEALVDNDFRSKDISLTIDSTAIKVKEVDLPNVSRDRALQFIKREFGSVISDEEHLFDYTIHSTYRRGRLPQMKCTIYAVPRDLLMNYNLLCKTLGLRLKRMDVLNDAITKQLEIGYPHIKKETKIPNILPPGKKSKKTKKAQPDVLNKEMQEAMEAGMIPGGIKGSVKLWVGFYYDKLKLITNGIRGDLFIKTIMLEGLERRDSIQEESESKELIALSVNEIKKFLQFQEEISPDYPVEQIELFGEHSMLPQLCGVIGSFVGKSTVLLSCPRTIKGVSDQEYAVYIGGIGNLVRR